MVFIRASYHELMVINIETYNYIRLWRKPNISYNGLDNSLKITMNNGNDKKPVAYRFLISITTME